MFSFEQIQEILNYTQQYSSVESDRVLLGKNDIPIELRSAVATQLSLQKKIEKKLPLWAKKRLYIPASINLEQASSELLARYKQRFLVPSDRLLDLSGGLGVDFLTMLESVSNGCYVEQDQGLHDALKYNASCLGISNKIQQKIGNSLSLINDLITQYQPTFVYVDPARREYSLVGKRVYALEDCSPNLYELIERIRDNNSIRLLAKVSPMLDLKELISRIPLIREIHIVAVRREVKELLLFFDFSIPYEALFTPKIIAIDILSSGGDWTILTGDSNTEDTLPIKLADSLGQYLYEPNGAIMKSGLYKTLSKEWGIPQLQSFTHLYTSDTFLKEFPGRILEIKEVIPFSSYELKSLKKRIPEAMISCRNFPISVEVLRKKLGIKDRGELALIGTRLWDNIPILLLTKPLIL